MYIDWVDDREGWVAQEFDVRRYGMVSCFQALTFGKIGYALS